MVYNLIFKNTIERNLQEEFKNKFSESPLVNFGNLNYMTIGYKYIGNKYIWKIGPNGMYKACIFPVYIRIPLEISNILLGALGDASNYDVLDVEINEINNQIIDLSTELLFCHPSCGLETAIDDNNAYAGIIRNNSTDYFNSTVINGDLTEDCIKYLLYKIHKNKGKQNKLIIMPLNQVIEYSRKQRQDFSIDSTGQTSLCLDGIPIIGVNDDNLTNTKVMAVDLSKRVFAYEPLSVMEVDKIDDFTKFEIRIGILFVLKDPRKSGKIIS